MRRKLLINSHGVLPIAASIKVPHSFVKDDAYKGYLEDRRPNSQGCPYQIVSRVLKTVAEVEAEFK
jgi:glutamine synthetase